MRIVFPIGSRANFGSLRSAMIACRRRGAAVLPVLYASATDERYGDVRGSLKRDGFDVERTLYGQVDEAMGITTGNALVQWASVLPWLNPSAVVVVGDRHEQMAPAIAAAYSGIKLIHQMGGERSGSIDDKVRDSITALADVHCVATQDAAERVNALLNSRSFADWIHPGRCEKSDIWVTGCPRIDTAREVLTLPARGEGRFLMVSQHPVTTQTHAENEAAMTATLAAVERVAMDRELAVELFWPNCDAGTGGTHRAIRAWLASPGAERLQVRTHRAMGPEDYMRMMAQTKCLVGNSSSGLREGAWIGTPVVNVGHRQCGRECGPNVLHTTHETVSDQWNGKRDGLLDVAGRVARNIYIQLDHGPYPSSDLYGDGTAGERVAEVVMGEAK